MTSIHSITIALVITAAALALSAGCTDIFTDSEVYPNIPTEGVSEYVPIAYSFNYKDKIITITIPVDKTVYTAAYNADKQAYLYDETISDEAWTDRYYRSFIDDESLQPLYDAILTEMRKVKSKLSLDSDSYAELIITYAQSMPYSTNMARSEPKFPIETVYEGHGDCDDKSLLAAALLSIEGYDVALMLFDAEEHMALGIKLPPEKAYLSYEGTGYAYVETTLGHYAGWPDIELNDDTKITTKPQIIVIGNGTLTYGSMDEVEAIYAAYVRANNIADSLLPRISVQEEDLNDLYNRINSLSANAKRMKSQNIAEYNRIVPVYNSLVNQYETATDELNNYISRYNEAVELSTYISENTYDRHGVYEKVKNYGK